MRWVGLALCTLVGCNAQSSTAGDAAAPSGFTSANHGVIVGPGLERQGCDASASPFVGTQCVPPRPLCLDGGIAVTYSANGCFSGTCFWGHSDVDCSHYDGGSCIGGWGFDGGLSLSDEGGLQANIRGCLVPKGPPPAQPMVPCDADASADAGADAAVCAPPRSFCLDSSGLDRWLLYYDNGRCVSGQCVWDLRWYACTVACGADGVCFDGLGTSPPPPVAN